MQAARLNIDESRAAEVTAYLRPNPDFSLAADGFQISRNLGVWRPLSGVVVTPGVSYLHERQHKRELRLETAKDTTEMAASTHLDQERGLIFNLRSAFVQTLQAKAVVQNARENLDYWDRELNVNRDRYRAGDLAQVDLDRLELQRVQFESDFETAIVNLCTAKTQLLMLLNDRTPIEQFDVLGPHNFTDRLTPMEEFRNIALETRPDLKAAVQSVDLAKANHQLAVANGATDPTFSVWYSHNPSFNNPYANETVDGSISIPLDQASNLGEQVYPYNYGLTHAPSSFDIKQNIVASYRYDLPFEKLFRHGNQATRGWAISGITRFSSGLPVTLVNPNDTALIGSYNNGVNGVGFSDMDVAAESLEVNRNPRNGQPAFNSALFSLPSLGSPGTADRRMFYGPRMNNWDIALLKETHFGGSKVLEFRLETFDIFNHAQFFGANSVDGNINDPTFGQVTNAMAPRLMQAALRFRF